MHNAEILASGATDCNLADGALSDPVALPAARPAIYPGALPEALPASHHEVCPEAHPVVHPAAAALAAAGLPVSAVCLALCGSPLNAELDLLCSKTYFHMCHIFLWEQYEQCLYGLLARPGCW